MPRGDSRLRIGLIGLIAYLAVLVGAAVWTLFGGPMTALLVLVIVPAFGALRPRWGLARAVVLLLCAVCWGTLVVFTLSRWTGVPAIALVLAVAVLGGAASAIRLHRRGWASTRGDLSALGFAGTGGVLWCTVIGIAEVLPGGAPVSWSMMGDSANNVLFARSLVEEGGIALGGANPVPLTSGLIALFMLPNHALVTSTASADIVALTQMWCWTIVAACVMSGLLLVAIVRRRDALGYLAIAGGSLLPLSWFILAGALGLGFVNFHLTLALLIGCLIVVVRARERPLATLVILSLALTSVLAVWAPLAGVPAVALALAIIGQWRAYIGLRGWRLVIAIAALLQSVVFFATVSLPSYFSQGTALKEAAGAVFVVSKRMLVAAAVATLVLGALYAWRRRSAAGVVILIAGLGGGTLGLAVLLWMRRGQQEVWAYYQLKYAWLLMALLFILAVAFAIALATSATLSAVPAAAATVVVVLSALGFAALVQATVPAYGTDPQLMRNPMARILTGDFFVDGKGDRVFHRVAQFTDAPTRSILWKSGDVDEGTTMFWIIQMSSSGVDDTGLRIYAYDRDLDSMKDLCQIRQRMGPPVEVITSGPALPSEVAQACPGLGAVIVR
ncbi:hypothetical protein [Microbacterium candidum]|uniref:Uncharacterized protein n=1 Tax=Microbacterium candidum TaxID=3041922 RepID=A0ABT7N0Y3_9MICO|nr:hypothetical protein [Microbacterium sp. ASV49]MDL9980321.1 hypothetical protein [Microbacterium sp. ASV49]